MLISALCMYLYVSIELTSRTCQGPSQSKYIVTESHATLITRSNTFLHDSIQIPYLFSIQLIISFRPYRTHSVQCFSNGKEHITHLYTFYCSINSFKLFHLFIQNTYTVPSPRIPCCP